MHKHFIALAAAQLMAPLGADAADLVVWWEKGFYAQEDEALAEVVAAFEQESGEQVEVTFHVWSEFPGELVAAVEAGVPPDVAFGLDLAFYVAEWASQDRLVSLSETVGAFSNLFDPEALERVTWRNAKTGQTALYALPIGRSSNHIHVWKNLLERADFTLEDIPEEWAAFWAFWCDEVQPAVRGATGRNDIWAVGLPMSVAFDTWFQFFQFLAAYEADYVTREGKLVIGDPETRQELVKIIDGYTSIYRKDCTPPDSITWGDYDNNEQFLAQSVVMTANETLSIPNSLKRERPDDYYEHVATIEWPLGPGGEPFPIVGTVFPAVVFKDGPNVRAAKEFIRFLVAEGWLMHYLNFSGERFLPPISKLLEQPFWLDPSDPHRMAAVMQVAARPLAHNYAATAGDRRHDLVDQEDVWAKAIYRVAADGITAEQAVDEAIARIEEILAE